MEDQLSRASQPWQMVIGPMSAAYMHFKEMEWKVDLHAPRDRWPESSQHRGGAGLAQGADYIAGKIHYRWLVKKGRMREAGALMSILTGAQWSP